MSSDATRAYVTNQGANSVSVIDTASNRVAATIPVGASPSAIAVTPNGEWLYILTGGGVVQVVDTVLRTVVAEIPTAGTAAGDIAITADGSKVYVAAGPVTVIDTATNTVVETFSEGSTGIELSPDGGRAYVTRMLTISVAVSTSSIPARRRHWHSSISACPGNWSSRRMGAASTRRSTRHG